MNYSILKISLISGILFFLSMNVGIAQSKTEKAVIKTNIYCSHCQQCGSCGKMLNKNLKAVEGIKKFALDEKAETFTITYDPTVIDVSKIRGAIASLGFDADDVKADPKAYDGLDECCKK